MSRFSAPIHPRLCGEPDRVTSIPEWLKTDHPREVIEVALAHVVRKRVEAAYARSDLFERRRRLMDDRAGYLAQGIGCPGRAGVRARLEGPPPSRQG